ncbi:unnamed protein product, partial [Rangifer tarandus platyrhynchus]
MTEEQLPFMTGKFFGTQMPPSLTEEDAEMQFGPVFMVGQYGCPGKADGSEAAESLRSRWVT